VLGRRGNEAFKLLDELRKRDCLMSEKTYNTLLNRPHITSVAEWVDIPSLPKWNRPYIRLLTIYISHYHCGSPRFHHGFSSGYDDDIQRVNAEQNNENNENKSSVDGTPTWFLSFHLRLVWGFILIERVFSRFRYMCGGIFFFSITSLVSMVV
jgi:hypothetical protein